MKKGVTLCLLLLITFSGNCQLKGEGEELFETKGNFPCGIGVSWDFPYSEDFGPSMEYIRFNIMGETNSIKEERLSNLYGRTLVFYIRKNAESKHLYKMEFKINYLLDSPHDIDCAYLIYIYTGSFSGSSLSKKKAKSFFKKGFFVDWISVE